MNKALEINDKLTKRLLLYIVLCSTFVSICSTFVQLYSFFQDELTLLEQRFDNIQQSYIPSIARGLWDFNKPLIAQQIQGIVDLPDIGFVEIENDFDYKNQVGNPAIIVKKHVEFPILFENNYVGKLYVYADYQDIYKRLWQQAGLILTTEFIKIFFIAFAIVLIVDKLIMRYLFQITNYAQALASDNLDTELILPNRPSNEDELDYLVNAINHMRIKLKDKIAKLEDAENALLALNGELEVKVHDRTAKLEKNNEQLQGLLDSLTLAQNQLVQSEKMASLGQLVAGVAHEVNTPLGICITSITALKERIEALQEATDTQQLSKSFLNNTLKMLLEYEQIIERSLNKAVELIRSFKSVAVEQNTDPKMLINIREHVYDVVNTVKTLFKQKKYHFNIQVDQDIFLLTYPSAWNQILTNFLMNSHIHGFEDRTEGEISINFSIEKDDLILLYTDNGKGIPTDFKKRIFDPFATTKRGQGGSGLGLNIVFNLVNTKMGGTIELLDSTEGVCFKVKVPMNT